VRVEAGGEGVVGHVGLHALGAFADRVGLGGALSAAVPWRGERAPVHDRGKVLAQTMLTLAGGGEACTDVEALWPQQALFGEVPSDSTVYRVFTNELSAAVVEGLWAAVASVREQVWRRIAATAGSAPVTLDMDSSLHEVHSENKEGTGPTYKGGFGFHPHYCFADATGEALAVKLRPGNAGANDLGDHLEVLDAAVAGLPAEVAAGHRDGDDPGLVRREVRVRTDAAGGPGLAWACRARNIGFATVARSTTQVTAAIDRARWDSSLWRPAVRQDGEARAGAEVAELTGMVDLSGWPPGTRLIVRSEPLHPGAQQSLFDHHRYRFWGHYSDAAGDPVGLDAHMRAHAHVEDHIKRLKDSGAHRFPFTAKQANAAWLAVVCLADGLVRWFQRLCLTGPLAKAEPKALRWALWHTPGRIVAHARALTVRVIDGWPGATSLLGAYQRINAIC
jgi:hypothetical protein